MRAAAGLLEALRGRGWTVATAESVTGGLLGGRITDVPGASRAFRGGVVAYSVDSKIDMLGVASDLIEREGVVSPGVARAMAQGVRGRLGADLGIATTGYAGPEGDAGRVLIALDLRGVFEVHEMRYPGAREKVREAAVEDALRFAHEAVLRAYPDERQAA